MGRRDRNSRRGRQKSNWASQRPEPKAAPRIHVRTESPEERDAREAAIREFKAREVLCPACGKPIEDLSSAIGDKASGQPMHFDCALKKVTDAEKPAPGKNVAYIGNGRFAVISYENPADTKHFKIEKIIEWEDRDEPLSWRGEMAELYSKVK